MKTEKLLGVGLLVFAALKLTEQPRYIVRPAQPAGNLQTNYLAWVQYAQAITAQAVNLYGSIQNAVKTLWGPGGPFEKTPVPQYDAGSLFWQDVGPVKVAGIGKFYDSTKIRPSGRVDAAPYMNKIFSRLNGRSIGAIYPEIPALYECNDGTFTTSASRRGCVRHGGKKTGVPVQLSDSYSGLLNIRDVSLDQIKIDTTLFQGREKEYSERSVNNIVQDAEAGRFLWENLDPIILWEDERGRLFLLSGHSRLEAFRRLARAGVRAQGKDFNRIPAKILKNVPVDVAQTVALESNTLSTKETDLERATYYRRLRQDGTPEKSVLEQVKKNEGRNWTNVYAYTFLSPNGYTWAALRQFAESEDTSATLAKSLAKWIGQARRQFPQLTNEHEGELYRWLFEQKGYGSGRNQVSSERDFLDKVAEFVQKNTFFGQFDPSKPLNIQNLLTKSPAEMEYDLQIDAAHAEVQAAENDLRAKIRQLAAANASKTDVSRITAPLEARLRNARLELSRLLQAREKVIEYSKNEPALFGYRRPRLRTPLFYS